jgi:hypothetical protein
MLLGLALLAIWPAGARGEGEPKADDPAVVEFFEAKVRPVLVARCLECHGAAKHKNGLRLDSREAALKGGITGPAVVPGKPEESPLVEAINYGEFLQMPPKSKLPGEEIASLTKWVAIGAPWPGAGEHGPKPAAAGRPFDLKARAQHWSFRPIRDPQPPPVARADWPRSPVDRFLLAALEAKGLTPARDADRRTLIRRATFDLIGLPPTPEEVETFLADRSADAYEKVVERLLASPHYGERWGRYWLDLVRYAETAGHEFDYEILGAHRYRDYIVRAFNADVPYDRLVVEHLAGDLLERPRRHPADGSNESILGTGFFFLGEGVHSPLDLREEAARRVDNQIDVLSKTFLGLTMACARCHDHKFDPIATKDYYALAGYLRSSRHQHAFLDAPAKVGTPVAELESLKARMRHIVASEAQDAAHLARWGAVLRDPRVRDPGHLLHAWAALADLPGDATPEQFASRRRQVIEALRAEQAKPDATILFEDFASSGYGDWTVSGDAFGSSPSRPGDFRVGPEGVVPVAPGIAHSGLASDRLRGVLRSKTFTIEHGRIHYLASGRGGRINLVVDGFEKIRSPIYGGLTIAIDHEDAPRWYTQDVAMWIGHDAYVEIADGATVDYGGTQSHYAPGDGFIAVDEIRFSDGAGPPSRPPWFAVEQIDDPGITSFELLADRLGREAGAIAEDWRAGRLGAGGHDAERTAALGWLVSHGLVRVAAIPAELLARYREVEARIPEPTLAPAIADGTGRDERVSIRGNYRTPGSVVPRRFLEVLAGPDQPAPSRGSGRLELARRVVDPSNPLPARVMVNRIWKHHFGEGLVKSADDFGAMGQPPSHPELLDYLASRFIRSGWSVRAMHRLIVLSRAYRMESVPAPEAERLDPDNRLLHRMGVRRLEAEAIRDAILAVSGRLDPAVGGPSVAPHLTPFMDGRGRPTASGPLDGDGRRSLYLNVRRNFLNPMFLAFDFPAPASTMGRRNVSNVPAQALTLLNDPFVVEQAHRWADRLLAEGPRAPENRIHTMYLAAFGRPPTEAERAEALAFVAGRADDPRAWADLGHVLFNVKEFIFLN